jgi:acylphosphatase
MDDLDSKLEQRGFRVRGHVHGVWFRWWTRRRALELGLRGTVRNSPDGSVEVHASGDREALDVFAAELEVGPPLARVEGVDGLPSDEDLPTGFEII